MTTDIYDRNAPKKATNVSLNRDLLAQARALNVNLSELLASSLEDVVRTARASEWRTQNRDAVEAYNDRIERKGAFGDKLRRF